MKGIILAGGNGTRLYPMTKVTNKHLLPVFNVPMIYYPIKTLVNSGITDIMIITGIEHAGDFIELLGTGKDFRGCKFTYRVQEEAGGIADALKLCEDFCGEDNLAVILGDNIFAHDFKIKTENFKSGAYIYLAEVDNPKRFGVATIEKDKVKNIEEKPKEPKTNLAVTGLYLYDRQVWQFIKHLVPSGRGELEISDVNNFYINQNELGHEVVEGFWSDAGTVDSLFTSSKHVKDYSEK